MRAKKATARESYLEQELEATTRQLGITRGILTDTQAQWALDRAKLRQVSEAARQFQNQIAALEARLDDCLATISKLTPKRKK